MRCPFCGNIDTQVKDSRPAEDHVSIRRRRFCPACGGRFTTYERVQLRDLVVVKSNGRREDFDRDKLERSIRIAPCRNAPVDPERVEQMISGIVRRLESLGETDIHSKVVGEIVMESLARIDTVAYVRFASVYKNFQAADDFDKFVSELRPEHRNRRLLRTRERRWMQVHGAGPVTGAAQPGANLAQPRCRLRHRARMAGSSGAAGQRPGGRPHAETQALAQAGTAARGATAYVSLEPCAHTRADPALHRGADRGGYLTPCGTSARQ